MLREHEEAVERLGTDDPSYYARMARGNTMRHREWLALREQRQHFRWAWHRFFQDWDVLLCPVAASTAFPHDHEGERYQRTVRVNNREVATTDQLFWAGFNGVCYLPGAVAPAGIASDGPARRRPDRRPLSRRPGLHPHRPPDRTPFRRLPAPAGILSGGGNWPASFRPFRTSDLPARLMASVRRFYC